MQCQQNCSRWPATVWRVCVYVCAYPAAIILCIDIDMVIAIPSLSIETLDLLRRRLLLLRWKTQ